MIWAFTLAISSNRVPMQIRLRTRPWRRAPFRLATANDLGAWNQSSLWEDPNLAVANLEQVTGGVSTHSRPSA
jgi:hypothetical protein